MEEPILTIFLPFPPSVNSLYARSRYGVYASKEYRRFKSAAGWSITKQRLDRPGEPWKIKGRVDITIELDRRRKGDADNRIKPVLDIMVSMGIIENDSAAYVRKASAEWSQDYLDGCIVNVFLAQDLKTKEENTSGQLYNN